MRLRLEACLDQRGFLWSKGPLQASGGYSSRSLEPSFSSLHDDMTDYEGSASGNSGSAWRLLVTKIRTPLFRDNKQSRVRCLEQHKASFLYIMIIQQPHDFGKATSTTRHVFSPEHPCLNAHLIHPRSCKLHPLRDLPHLYRTSGLTAPPYLLLEPQPHSQTL